MSIPTQQEYEERELLALYRQLEAVDHAPLAERKENYANFADTLKNEPKLVIDRVDWLLDGSYGYGSYQQSVNIVVYHPRMNRRAYLVQTIAALEWGCARRDAIRAWKQLDNGQKANLAIMLDDIMRDHIERHTESN